MEGEFALCDSDDREQAECLFLEVEKNRHRSQSAQHLLCFQVLARVNEDSLELHPSS
jgi:hypothetical protein